MDIAMRRSPQPHYLLLLRLGVDNAQTPLDTNSAADPLPPHYRTPGTDIVDPVAAIR
jgi:hypothetical protein